MYSFHNVTYQNSNVERVDIEGEILARVLQAANELSYQMNYDGTPKSVKPTRNY